MECVRTDGDLKVFVLCVIIHNSHLAGHGLCHGHFFRRCVVRKPLSIAVRLIALLPFFIVALAQEPVQTIHGTWIATAGKGLTLHGTWRGSALPEHPDMAEGTWMLATSGEIVIEGTWRAKKETQGWQGHWTAHTVRGQALTGTWGADVEHWQGKTFQDLLNLTLQEEVSGWWQIGARQGNWWLKGSANREQPRGSARAPERR